MLGFASFNFKLVKDKELRNLMRIIRMASKNRSITLECSICKKKMRSDTLKRHWSTKLKNFDFKVTTVVRGFLKEKDGEPSSNEDLESGILANDKLLNEKMRVW